MSNRRANKKKDALSTPEAFEILGLVNNINVSGGGSGPSTKPITGPSTPEAYEMLGLVNNINTYSGNKFIPPKEAIARIQASSPNDIEDIIAQTASISLGNSTDSPGFSSPKVDLSVRTLEAFLQYAQSQEGQSSDTLSRDSKTKRYHSAVHFIAEAACADFCSILQYGDKAVLPDGYDNIDAIKKFYSQSQIATVLMKVVLLARNPQVIAAVKCQLNDQFKAMDRLIDNVAKMKRKAQEIKTVDFSKELIGEAADYFLAAFDNLESQFPWAYVNQRHRVVGKSNLTTAEQGGATHTSTTRLVRDDNANRVPVPPPRIYPLSPILSARSSAIPPRSSRSSLLAPPPPPPAPRPSSSRLSSSGLMPSASRPTTSRVNLQALQEDPDITPRPRPGQPITPSYALTHGPGARSSARQSTLPPPPAARSSARQPTLPPPPAAARSSVRQSTLQPPPATAGRTTYRPSIPAPSNPMNAHPSRQPQPSQPSRQPQPAQPSRQPQPAPSNRPTAPTPNSRMHPPRPAAPTPSAAQRTQRPAAPTPSAARAPRPAQADRADRDSPIPSNLVPANQRAERVRRPSPPHPSHYRGGPRHEFFNGPTRDQAVFETSERLQRATGTRQRRRQDDDLEAQRSPQPANAQGGGLLGWLGFRRK